MMRSANRRKPCRSGLAALELALCLPMLCFIVSAVIDYGRLFHDIAIINDCTRNGALQACGLTNSFNNSVPDAALANVDGLSGDPPTVNPPTYGTDSSGNAYCEVTVTYTYHTLTPWLSSTVTISRKMRMAVQPSG